MIVKCTQTLKWAEKNCFGGGGGGVAVGTTTQLPPVPPCPSRPTPFPPQELTNTSQFARAKLAMYELGRLPKLLEAKHTVRSNITIEYNSSNRSNSRRLLFFVVV